MSEVRGQSPTRRSQSGPFGRDSAEPEDRLLLNSGGDGGGGGEANLRAGILTGASAAAASDVQLDIVKSPAAASVASGDEGDALLPQAAQRGAFAHEKRSPTPTDVTLAALFGEHFHPPEAEVVPDPANYDARQLLLELFGLDEATFPLAADTAEADLRHLKEEHQRAMLLDEVRAVFGEESLRFIAPDAIGRPINSVIKARVPAVRFAPQERILISMPQVGGITQTLHADPKLFARNEVPPLSTRTEHFTASNVMRWAVANDKPYSNTRLVLWSDGTRTLHIGPDVFEAHRNTDVSLNMVACDTELEGRNGIKAPAKVAALPFVDHWNFTTPAVLANSVNERLVHASNVVEDVQGKVGLLQGTIAPIGVQKDKKPPRNAAPPIEEEFLEIRRRMQERDRQRNKDMPSSITQLIQEEFDNYNQLSDLVAGHSVADKVRELREVHERRVAYEAVQNARKGKSGRKAETEYEQGTTTNAPTDAAPNGEGSSGGEEEDEEEEWHAAAAADRKKAKAARRRDETDDNDGEDDDILLTSRARKEDASMPPWKATFVALLQGAMTKASAAGDTSNYSIIKESLELFSGSATMSEEDWRSEVQKLAADVGEAILSVPAE